MRVPFRQTTKKGCGSYCLANLFNMPEMLEGVHLCQGETAPYLNLKMAEYMKEFYVDVLAMTNTGLKAHNRLRDAGIFEIDDSISPEMKREMCRPFLIVVINRAGNLHCVLALHDYYTQRLIIVDSMDEYAVNWEPEQFMNAHHVVTIMHFGIWSCSPDVSLLFERASLPHLI